MLKFFIVVTGYYGDRGCEQTDIHTELYDTLEGALEQGKRYKNSRYVFVYQIDTEDNSIKLSQTGGYSIEKLNKPPRPQYWLKSTGSDGQILTANPSFDSLEKAKQFADEHYQGGLDGRPIWIELDDKKAASKIIGAKKWVNA